jgi:hypothetical protein
MATKLKKLAVILGALVGGYVLLNVGLFIFLALLAWISGEPA